MTSPPKVPVANLKSGPSPAVSPAGNGTPARGAASGALASTAFFASLEGIQNLGVYSIASIVARRSRRIVRCIGPGRSMRYKRPRRLPSGNGYRQRSRNWRERRSIQNPFALICDAICDAKSGFAAKCLKHGAGEGNRTPDLRFTKPLPKRLPTSDQRVTVHVSRAGLRP